jgi:hypothetical protein
MAITTAPHSSSHSSTVGQRRFGYAVAVLVNAAMLYAVNVWPRWDILPFLTDDTKQLIPWVNTSILVSLVANLVYMMSDQVWLKASGDIATAAVGVVVLVWFWQVFPFDFGDATFDWALLTRIVLGVGIAGSAIGILAGVVRLARAAVGANAPSR